MLIVILQFYIFYATNPKSACNFSDKNGKIEIFLPKAYSAKGIKRQSQTKHLLLHIAFAEKHLELELIGAERYHT